MLTEKGQEAYEEKVVKVKRTLIRLHSQIDDNIANIEKYKDNRTVLKEVCQIIKEDIARYQEVSDEFCEYLSRTKTKEAMSEFSWHLVIRSQSKKR